MRTRIRERCSTVTGGILCRAADVPGKPALIVGNDSLSYGELAGNAARLAGRLPGSSPPRRTGIVTTDPAGLIEAFLAAGLAGSSAAVLDPAWSPGQMAEAMQQAKPDEVVAHRSCTRRLPPTAAPTLIPGRFDGDSGHRSVPACLGTGQQELLVGFTSGSTGVPKAFARSHESWMHSFQAATGGFGIRADDVILVPGPLQYSLFLFACLHALWEGATAVVLPRFSPGRLAEAVERTGVTRIWAVPTMIVAASHRLTAVAPTARRRIMGVYCSGSAWPAEQRRRCEQLFTAAEVVEFYGAGELSFVAYSSNRVPTADPDAMAPFPGVEFRVRAGTAGPGSGAEGLIFVRSPMLFDGYLGCAPDGFQRDREGWTTVGDRGRLCPGGALRVTGRSDSTICCAGRSVHPEPIERVLQSLPEVAEAAVVGLADAVRGQKAVALVRWRPDATPPSRAALSAACRAELGQPGIPHEFREAAALPRTPAGKVARARLEQALADGSLATRTIR